MISELPVPTVLDQRFAIGYRPNSIVETGLQPELFDYVLRDRVTGAVDRDRSVARLIDKATAILAREAEIPWDDVAAYDLFLSPLSIASPSVWAHGEDGERLRLPDGRFLAPLLSVGHDYDEAVVEARVAAWFAALGQAPRPRAPQMLQEREARIATQATTTIVPGKRRRLSPLAGRQLAFA